MTHLKPSLIYMTRSAPFDSLWRRDAFPEYQSKFQGSYPCSIYNQNLALFDDVDFAEHFPMIRSIQCPSQTNESGDLIASLIQSHTTELDDICVLSQPHKFEQLLGVPQRRVELMKTVRKDEDAEDAHDELNFAFESSAHNSFGLRRNECVLDYLSLVGIASDSIAGVKVHRTRACT